MRKRNPDLVAIVVMGIAFIFLITMVVLAIINCTNDPRRCFEQHRSCDDD